MLFQKVRQTSRSVCCLLVRASEDLAIGSDMVDRLSLNDGTSASCSVDQVSHSNSIHQARWQRRVAGMQWVIRCENLQNVVALRLFALEVVEMRA